MKIVLEGERPVSWNKFYAGMHWGQRKLEADRVHELVGWTLKELAYGMFETRVDIQVVVYFKNRPQDSDNICSKMYIDSLKGFVIEDDTREFVRKVTVQSEVDKEFPRVEIIVEGCE